MEWEVVDFVAFCIIGGGGAEATGGVVIEAGVLGDDVEAVVVDGCVGEKRADEAGECGALAVHEETFIIKFAEGFAEGVLCDCYGADYVGVDLVKH